ncbi:MAG: hypothetical protein ACJATT_002745 [Myxococcota bacterium]|jgi:hypothetical protein
MALREHHGWQTLACGGDAFPDIIVVAMAMTSARAERFSSRRHNIVLIGLLGA